MAPPVETAVLRKLLADAIPALSFAMGANSLNIYGTGRNKNMSDPAFRSGDYSEGKWPRDGNLWKHSDIKNIAYPFNYSLFDDIVTEGGLK